MLSMATNGTLLCIHGQPSQLNLLQENGYELATATNTSDGLKLLQSRPVDAVLVEYQLCLSENAAVADEIKRVRPELPIVMLVDHLDLPPDALRSADALVAKSDGDHFLWATVHFLLNVKPVQRQQPQLRAQTPASSRHPGESTGSR
jgi:response regulator RpfG family c-di-GMP phosphodiesterase